MEKVRSIVASMYFIGAYAAIALLRRAAHNVRIIVDYKPTTNFVGLDENEVLVLTETSHLAQYASSEGISLPRAVARFILKNEKEKTVARFLRRVESLLKSRTAEKNLRKQIEILSQNFSEAEVVRMITAQFEELLYLASQEVSPETFITKEFGNYTVAVVTGKEDPFLSDRLIRRKEIDLVIQDTATGPQLTAKSSTKTLAAEISRQIRKESLAKGDGLFAPDQTGNTITFYRTRLQEGFFPTVEDLLYQTEKICEEWSAVTEKEFEVFQTV